MILSFLLTAALETPLKRLSKTLQNKSQKMAQCQIGLIGLFKTVKAECIFCFGCFFI